MKEWSYTFDPVSSETWIRQIERDLKGKPMHSLQSEWWPGELLNPIHHAALSPVQLPDYLFTSPPAILEYIDARSQSPDQLNEQLLQALRYGAETILLHLDQTHTAHPDSWLKGIYAEMINWHFITDNPDIGMPALSAKLQDQAFHRITLDRSFEPAQLIEGGPPYKWVYDIPGTGTWDAQTASILNRLLEDRSTYAATTGKSDFLQQCVLAIDADADYLKCIIQFRVLHIIWQNLIRLDAVPLPNTKSYHLECHIRPTERETADHYLVRATTAAVAASLSGVNGLCIHPKEDGAGYYRRINRNIHHLLRMESNLPKETDPLAGAYAIDHYTRSWANSIWDQLHIA